MGAERYTPIQPHYPWQMEILPSLCPPKKQIVRVSGVSVLANITVCTHFIK